MRWPGCLKDRQLGFLLKRPKAAYATAPDQQKIASLTARERAIAGELLRDSGTDSRRLSLDAVPVDYQDYH